MDREPQRIFDVTGWVDVLGRAATRHQPSLLRLGRLETRLFSHELAEIPIDRPIFIAGLARAGTTILLEALESHPDTVSHRYRDFPLVLTPLFWNRFLDRVPRREDAPRERAHRDGIVVTAESPEAFEEVLWMAFFPDIHEVPAQDVFGAQASHPAFESFYRDHLRKLLLLRRGSRYLSKANYNVTRLEYLLRLFPDARIVVPVRDPVWHVASLMKQHRLFCAGQREEPRALPHLQRVGHFEFGLDRRPITAGDPEEACAIARLWQDGRELEGWARYWSHIHRFVADRLAENSALRDAALVVRCEDLWDAPRRSFGRILDHCGLMCGDDFIGTLAARIRPPGYYRPEFSPAELEVISKHTAATALRFGYPDPAGAGRPAAEPSPPAPAGEGESLAETAPAVRPLWRDGASR